MSAPPDKIVPPSARDAGLFVGRQPICDSNLDTVAYELLFRNDLQDTRAEFTDADTATARVILNTFLEIGLDNIVGQLPAFINLTRGFILGRDQLPLPPDRVILEVLEDIHVDQALVAGLRRLKSEGFTIALDDFLYQPAYEQLIDVADIVKLDIKSMTEAELVEHARILHGHDVRLLAEKVERRGQFERCRELGFDYYQGFLFAAPKTIRGQRAPVSRPDAVRRTAQLLDSRCAADRLSARLRKDMALSYRIIGAINHGYCALPKHIDTVEEAIAVLGVEGVRNLAALLTLAHLADSPRYLMETLLTRSKMAERLAAAGHYGPLEPYFRMGMVSMLPPLLDWPVESVVRELPLEAAIKAALSRHEGLHGQVLQCIMDYERGRWDAVACPGLSQQAIRRSYLEAINWCNEVYGQLVG